MIAYETTKPTDEEAFSASDHDERSKEEKK